jgi:hypothetical protein
VNHYFTRGVVLQLLEQRGVLNKFNAIRARVANLGQILELMTDYTTAGLSLGASVRQIRVALWALVATLIFSVASLAVAIISLAAA